jgi:hypothetical protein
MVARKSTIDDVPARPELDALVEKARIEGVSEAQLRDQRVSFAYGNAPASAERITKESVRAASSRSKLLDV